jgi:hypothetical protein
MAPYEGKQRMAKWVRRLLIVAVTAMAGAAVATPASAACPTGDVCEYENANYGGGKYQTPGNNETYHDGDTYDNGTVLYDRTTSVENMSSGCWWVIIYPDHFYGGTYFGVNPGGVRSQLPSANDNTASSHNWQCI